MHRTITRPLPSSIRSGVSPKVGKEWHLQWTAPRQGRRARLCPAVDCGRSLGSQYSGRGDGSFANGNLGADARNSRAQRSELERLLGRKTMEVEMLKEALDLARVKNRPCCRGRSLRRIPREEDRRDHGVARSNLIERAAGQRPKRGPQTEWRLTEFASDISTDMRRRNLRAGDQMKTKHGIPSAGV
jgi:hypothetical protein